MPHSIGASPSHLGVLFHDGSTVGLTDGQLLERFATREGEAAELAFAAIVERHGGMVFLACRSLLRDEHDARDAFQATFLALVRKAGSLWVEDSIGPWLHRVACRAAGKVRRAAKGCRERERKAAEAEGARDDEHAERRELAAAIHEEVARLPGAFRAAVVLCDLEGRPYEDAARQMGCAVGTVKSRLARGRGRLRDRLVRRGLAPASGAILGAEVASAAVPVGWADRAVRAVAPRGVALGAARADTLTGGFRAMRHHAIWGAGGLVVAFGLMAGFAWMAPGAPSPQGKAARPGEEVRPGGPKPAVRSTAGDVENAMQAVAQLRAVQDMEEIELDLLKEQFRDVFKETAQLKATLRRPGEIIGTKAQRQVEIERIDGTIKFLSESRMEFERAFRDRSLRYHLNRLRLLEAEKALEAASAAGDR